MRVSLFADSPQEHWPSMERYARALYAAIQRIAPPQIQARLLVPPPAPQGFGPQLRLVWRLLVYPGWAKRCEADVNHVLDHSYGHLLFALDPKRTIVTVHDVAPLVFPSKKLGLSNLSWAVAWRGTQRAHAWVAISDFTYMEIVNRSHHIKPERVTRIYYGIEPHFRPLQAEAREKTRNRLGLGDIPLILHVGHCQPRKNIERLIEALSLLKETIPTFWFLQVGGRFTPTQQDLLERFSLRRQTHQIAHISNDEELVALYNAADVLVLPSLYEGFGFPALEAMACGLPVVASSVASLPEVVGEAGILVDPLDAKKIAAAILSVLSTPSVAAEMRQRGLERSKLFSWEQAARETLKIYTSVGS